MLAAKGHVSWALLLYTLLGTSLVIASACVFNNYTDRGIDKKMKRTARRALVEGRVSARKALTFASVLGVVGFSILILHVNGLTALVGAVGFIDYVILYGFSKRRTVYGTLVGTISGATPPLAGYTAVTGHIDAGAILVFLIIAFWQMPHFFAIALYRKKDYAAADIPVWPVKRGDRSTKVQMIWYTALFTAACCSLTVFGYTGITFLVVMLGAGLYWLWRCIQGFGAPDTALWARKMFFFSLIITILLTVMLVVGPLLP